jgi:hypothetical protein
VNLFHPPCCFSRQAGKKKKKQNSLRNSKKTNPERNRPKRFLKGRSENEIKERF